MTTFFANFNHFPPTKKMKLFSFSRYQPIIVSTEGRFLQEINKKKL